MTVRYVRVKPVADLFAPAVRAYGNIAIVGPVTPPGTPPGAPTAAAATGTALGVGAYRYMVTFVTPGGETEAGSEISVTTTAGSQAVALTAIPTGPTGTTARKVYRTAVGGVSGSQRLVTTIGDNTTATFTDTVPDAALGDEPPIARSNVPIAFTDPAEASRRVPGPLASSIGLAFAQSPGPTLVYGVRTASGPNWSAALTAVATLDVQLVVLADEPLNATSGGTGGSVRALADHVISVSNTGGDGLERIGVAMLAKDVTDPTIVAGALAHERLVYVAHKSDEDVATAVAGTIAGYEPHVSMLFKPVAVSSGAFSSAEIGQLNGSETFTSGPAGRGVNWLVDPPLIPGQAVYLGEGYTGNPGGKKYIDVVRTIDNVRFLLKARLIRSIGDVRISRSGLRTLGAQIESVLEPLIRQGVIEGYTILMPVLTLLDKPVRTAAEDQQVNNAQSERVVEVLVAVDYAGAIHRIALTLKFE